jgi:hypothetical protein
MKHADPVLLAQMSDLLTPLRKHPQLVERTPGNFVRGSSEFLHLYEDPATFTVIAEVKTGTGGRKRLPVSTPEERRTLFAFILATLARMPASAEPAVVAKRRRPIARAR